MKKAEQLFALKMLDCATPPYCTFSKTYIGSIQDIECVINRLRDIPEHMETVEAFDSYLSGNLQAAHRVAYKKERILRPVKQIAKNEFHLEETIWEHINIWGFPYKMRFSHADIERAAIIIDGQNVLCCRARMHDLCYEAQNQWYELIGGFWGNEWIMKVETQPDSHFSVRNDLYIEEDFFDSTEMMLESLADESTINLGEIVNEIFGDG